MSTTVPTTVVPGATPKMDGEGIGAVQARDKKGRPLWNMPPANKVHLTTQVVKKLIKVDGKPKQIKVKEKVAFPLFRGTSASYARSVRSHFRRLRREQTALQRAKDDAVTFVKDVLNPLGG